MITVAAGRDDDGRRLDRIIRRAFPGLPFSAIHRLLRTGGVLLNGCPAGPAARVRCGDIIRCRAAPEDRAPLPPTGAKPCGAPPEALFENGALLFLNKAAGVSTHGPRSLEAAAAPLLAAAAPPSLSFRPGPLHRLDRGTSGVITFSKTRAGAAAFSEALREGRIKKTYLALFTGVLTQEEYWEDYLLRRENERQSVCVRAGTAGARKALTRVLPIASGGNLSFARVEIESGRRHQIRACAAARGHALYGDALYGGGAGGLGKGGYLLHAYSLGVPALAGEPPALVTAPLPEPFCRALSREFPSVVLGPAF